jgi:hypothetical protein
MESSSERWQELRKACEVLDGVTLCTSRVGVTDLGEILKGL